MIGKFEAIFHPLVIKEFKPENITTRWNSKSIRIPDNLKKEIDQFWFKLSSESFYQHSLYNGKLARLDAYRVTNNQLELALSKTDYKTLIYSNNHIDKIIANWGEKFLSRALGISAVVVSADHQVVFMKRSLHVGEYPNTYDVFGGHIEICDKIEQSQPNVFSAIAKELEEELYLNTAEYDVICIGLLESSPNRKPELVFRVQCIKTTVKEIIDTSKKAVDAHEYTMIFSVPDSREKLLDFIHKNDFSPSAFGCVWLYINLENH